MDKVYYNRKNLSRPVSFIYSIIITTGCMGNNSVALIASFKILVSLDSISGKQNY